MVKYLKEFLGLTLGEQVFTLVWAWDTRAEREGDWIAHLESAIERASTEAEKNGFGF